MSICQIHSVFSLAVPGVLEVSQDDRADGRRGTGHGVNGNRPITTTRLNLVLDGRPNFKLFSLARTRGPLVGSAQFKTPGIVRLLCLTN
jgi:hypothetical protein